MTANGECQKNDPFRSWGFVKILMPRHLCVNVDGFARQKKKVHKCCFALPEAA